MINNGTNNHSLFIGSNICQRHALLYNTIGVLPEELEAYNLIIVLVCVSTLCLLFLTIMELGFFCLYNGKFHPFASILEFEGELLFSYHYFSKSEKNFLFR